MADNLPISTGSNKEFGGTVDGFGDALRYHPHSYKAQPKTINDSWDFERQFPPSTPYPTPFGLSQNTPNPLTSNQDGPQYLASSPASDDLNPSLLDIEWGNLAIDTPLSLPSGPVVSRSGYPSIPSDLDYKRNTTSSQQRRPTTENGGWNQTDNSSDFHTTVNLQHFQDNLLNLRPNDLQAPMGANQNHSGLIDPTLDNSGDFSNARKSAKDPKTSTRATPQSRVKSRDVFAAPKASGGRKPRGRRGRKEGYRFPEDRKKEIFQTRDNGACLKCRREKCACGILSPCTKCKRNGVVCCGVRKNFEELLATEEDTRIAKGIEFESSERLVPLSDVICLPVLCCYGVPQIVSGWSTVIIGQTVRRDVRDLDSGLCVHQIEKFISPHAKSSITAAALASAREGDAQVLSMAERFAAYVRFLRKLPHASFRGRGKSFDQDLSKRIAWSIFHYVVNHLWETYNTTLISIYNLFVPKPIKKQREDFAMLAVCIVVQSMEDLSTVSFSRSSQDELVKMTNKISDTAKRLFNGLHKLGQAAPAAGLAIPELPTDFDKMRQEVLKEDANEQLNFSYESSGIDVRCLFDPNEAATQNYLENSSIDLENIPHVLRLQLKNPSSINVLDDRPQLLFDAFKSGNSTSYTDIPPDQNSSSHKLIEQGIFVLPEPLEDPMYSNLGQMRIGNQSELDPRNLSDNRIIGLASSQAQHMFESTKDTSMLDEYFKAQDRRLPGVSRHLRDNPAFTSYQDAISDSALSTVESDASGTFSSLSPRKRRRSSRTSDTFGDTRLKFNNLHFGPPRPG